MKYREEKKEEHERTNNYIKDREKKFRMFHLAVMEYILGFFHVMDWIQKQECSIIHDDH